MTNAINALTSRRALLTGLAATPIAIAIAPAVKAMENVHPKPHGWADAFINQCPPPGMFGALAVTSYPLAYGSVIGDGIALTNIAHPGRYNMSWEKHYWDESGHHVESIPDHEVFLDVDAA